MLDKLVDFFRAGGRRDPETHELLTQKKLVELFQNRNELKRLYDRAAQELERLREETVELRKKLEQTGKRLESLDTMLADPEKGQSVIVYYQLEAIWSTCRERLRTLAAELQKRLEKEERDRLLAEFNRSQADKTARLTERLRQVEQGRDELKERLERTRRQLDSLNWFMKLFRRKRLMAEIAELERNLAPIEKRCTELSTELAVAQATPPPEYPGLSVAARRAINLHLIALAQELYITFLDDNLAVLAHEAHGRLPHESDYGRVGECQQLLKLIEAAFARYRADTAQLARLRKRYEHMLAQARYNGEQETLPQPDAWFPFPGKLGSTGQEGGGLFDLKSGMIPVNVVEKDYWDISEFLFK